VSVCPNSSSIGWRDPKYINKSLGQNGPILHQDKLWLKMRSKKAILGW
jgi:hypothetical protein